ncbi:hypothetical protein PGT21_002641 [Puccinia graminis f. sp. tritici]|uniref:Secreted protein n=1 Tax=Puccinia graminis f. sp. tritici TaxID=56615 RepID=A0A5B0NY81_PUCGR|nr:hypothetical protein PGT21_002641 [Puccinia graminis f. sp. tritici]
MFTLMLRAYAITAVIFLVFSVQISAAEDCNEQNGCVQHCGTSMQPHYDDPKTKTFSEMTWERCSRPGNQNDKGAAGVEVIKTVYFRALNEAGVVSVMGSEQNNPKEQTYECRWKDTSQHNSRRPYCSQCKTIF